MKRYPSDLTDREWAVLEPLLPRPKEGGRPQEHSYQEIVNAIFYVDRAGCAWRMLPHDLTNWRTVYHYFRAWRVDGSWERVQDALREKARVRVGCKRHLLVDTQGLLLEVKVLPANITDREGGQLLLPQVTGEFPSLSRLFVDGGYKGRWAEWARETLGWGVQVVQRPLALCLVAQR